MRYTAWLADKIINWLMHEKRLTGIPLSDFSRLCFEIRPSDVVLIEGRSRVSNVIKNITHSPWTHSALYLGRLHDIENEATRALVANHYDGDVSEQLLLEALLGEGIIVAPLSKYNGEHLRICRPKGLSLQDSTKVIDFAGRHLGADYDVRQLFDLARLMLPYSLVPRRFASSLFEYHAGVSTRTVCSSMIGAAFSSVQFPILPVIHRGDNGSLQMYKRNERFYTPRDFDYSPYFDIIKYPFLGFDDLAVYRQLPWDQNGVVCNDANDCFIPSREHVEPDSPPNGEASPAAVTSPAQTIT